MRTTELIPVYCDTVPDKLEEGKVYISEKYKTAIHLCACGCKVKTVTPFSNGGWCLADNNGKITISPSIGNFSGENPYHAHYFVTDGKIIWCS